MAMILTPYILIYRLAPKAEQICEFCLLLKHKLPGAGDICGYSSFEFDLFGDELFEGRTMRMSESTNDTDILLPNDQPPASSSSPSHPGINSKPTRTMTSSTPPTTDVLHTGARTIGTNTSETLAESIIRTGHVETATQQHPKPRAREGKMEKSFFNFRAAHPSWKCHSGAQQELMSRVEEYRQQQLQELARERDVYIDAAARQLETLALLEQQQQQQQGRSYAENPLSTIDEEYLSKGLYPTRGPLHTSNGRSSLSRPLSNITTDDHTAAAAPPVPQIPPLPPLVNSAHRTASLDSRGRISNSVTFAVDDGMESGRTDATTTTTATTSYHTGRMDPTIAAMTTTSGISFGSSSTSTATMNGGQLMGQTGSSTSPTMSHPTTSSPTTSPRGALRAGLSTELRRILNMSTLDAGESVFGTGSVSAGNPFLLAASPANEPSTIQADDRAAERQVRTHPFVSMQIVTLRFYNFRIISPRLSPRTYRILVLLLQYYWLERFRAHLEAQQQQEMQQQQLQQQQMQDDASRSLPIHSTNNVQHRDRSPMTTKGTSSSIV